MRGSLLGIVLAAFTTVASRASADPGELRKLTLLLQTDADSRPTHLCVLAEATSEDDATPTLERMEALKVLSSSLYPGTTEFKKYTIDAKSLDERCTLEKNCIETIRESARAARRKAASVDVPAHCTDAPEGKLTGEKVRALTNCADDSRCSVRPGSSCANGALLNALEILRMPAFSRKACAGDCARVFRARAADESKLKCTSNRQTTGEGSSGRPRIVVLALTPAFTTAPWLRRVELDGDSAVLTLEETSRTARGEPAALSLSVAGGDYLEGDSTTAASNTMTLSLLPRCGEHTVTLSGGGFSAGPGGDHKDQVNMSLGADQCAEIGGAPPFSVLLPYSRSARTISVTRSRTGPHPLAARYEGELRAGRPPRVMNLLVKRTSFTWSPPCAYSWPDCPKVALPDAGGDCQLEPSSTMHADRDRTCEYTCPVGSDLPEFNLPQRIVFRASGPSGAPSTNAQAETPVELRETWTDTLYRSGQHLESYTAPKDRHVGVSFADWDSNDIDGFGRVVDYVEISGPDGARHRVRAITGDPVRVSMPGLSCSDHVSYRIAGDRTYGERVVDVSGGTLNIPRPDESLLDGLSVGILAGGGIRMKIPGFAGDDPLGGSASLDGVVTWRVPAVFGAPRYVPEVEFRGGILYLEMPYQTRLGSRTDGVSVPDLTDSASYLFVPITVGPTWALPWKTYFGLNGGVAYGIPIVDSDRERAPRQWAGVFTGLFGVRAPRMRLAIEFAFEALYAGLYRMHFDALGGQPVVEVERGWPLLAMVRARADLN